MENLIELLKKIITNVLTALYQPFWFAVILTVIVSNISGEMYI